MKATTESKTTSTPAKGNASFKTAPKNHDKISKRAKKANTQPKNLNNELNEEKPITNKDVDMPLREEVKTTETDPKKLKNNLSTEPTVTQSSESVSSTSSDKTETAGNNDTTKSTTSNNQFYALDGNAQNNKNPKNSKSNSTKSNSKIIKRNFDGLFTLKLQVKSTNNAVREMQRVLQEWLQTIKDVDPSVVIYDWKNNTKERAISKSTEITTKVAAMKQYFFQVRPRSKAGTIWAQVHIGHDTTLKEIDESMEWWYQENKTGLYKKPLQHKDAVQVAWLLYSHEKVDRDNLLENLSKKCKLKWSRTIPMALSWNQIKDGIIRVTNRNKDFDTTKTYPYAIHVHCREQDKEQVRAFIKTTYNSNQTKFPNMMAFRYVPVLDRTATTHLKQKIRRLRTIQIGFLESIIHATTWEIDTLDYKSDSLTMTLREMLMLIRPEAYDDHLFLAINDDKNGGHTFTFPSDYEEKARDFIMEFPAYLKWKYGDDIVKYLTIPAIDRLADTVWDPQLGKVVTEEDRELDRIENEAKKRKWMKEATEDEKELVNSDTNNQQRQQDNHQNAPLFEFGNNIRSDQSVSTFGTYQDKNGDTNKEDDNDNKSTRSEDTMSTMNSKNTVATRMTNVEGRINTMDGTLNAILNSLNRLTNGSVPSPGKGEIQEKESSANAVSPTSDTAMTS